MDPNQHMNSSTNSDNVQNAGAASAAVPPAIATPASPANPSSVAASWLPPSVPVKPSASNAAGKAAGQAPVNIPAVADDGDIIEKEWVMKAKQIVEATRQDPYRQTKEIHKFKAEYMKKRYNKIIETV